MTVKELMEVLSGMPEDAVVVMCQTYSDGWDEQKISTRVKCVKGCGPGFVHLTDKQSYNDEDGGED